MVLELLPPICKREKKQHPQPWLFSTRSALPCSRWGYRQTLHRSFPSLVCPLPTQVSCPSRSTTEVAWRRTRGRPDGIPDSCPVPYHQHLCLVFPFPLIPPRVEPSSFPRMFPKVGLLGEVSMFRVPMYIPEYSPGLSRSSES